MKSAPTILIVGNDPLTLWSLKSVLAKTGYKTLTAINMQRALELFRTAQFNLVVADDDFPEVESLGILNDLRAARGLVPVVIVGSSDIETGAQKIKGKSQVVYYEKPIDIEEFTEMVEGLVRGKG